MSWVHDLDDPRRSGSSIYLNVFAFEEQGPLPRRRSCVGDIRRVFRNRGRSLSMSGVVALSSVRLTGVQADRWSE
jgi:hypothetical protein